MKSKISLAALMGLAGGASLIKFLETNPQASPDGVLDIINGMDIDQRRQLAYSVEISPGGNPMTVESSDNPNGNVDLEAYDNYVYFPFDDGTGPVNTYSTSGGNSSLIFNEGINQLGLLFDEAGERKGKYFEFDTANNKFILGQAVTVSPTSEPTPPPLKITNKPSLQPTHIITRSPTGEPTLTPVSSTGVPSKQPSHFIGGTTEAPTLIELDSSGKPTGKPTPIPTVEPSKDKPEIDIVPIVAGIGVITIVGGFLALRRCLGRNQPNRNWAGVVENQNPEQNVLHDVSNPMENLTGGSEVDPENPITRPRPVTLEGEAPPAPPAR
ncbi:MAG: hypothetical protein ACI9TO_001064, partial [Rickettsiales bacterium]